MNGALHAREVLAAERDGDDDVRAQRDTHGEADDKAHQRHIGAEGSHANSGMIAGEAADDENADEGGELLEDARGGHGDGEAKHGPPQGAGEHVDLFSHECALLFGRLLAIKSDKNTPLKPGCLEGKRAMARTVEQQAFLRI